MSEIKIGKWTVDPEGANDGDLHIDCEMGSVIIKVNEDGISADIWAPGMPDGPAASCWAARGDLEKDEDSEADSRCPHEMFHSGAGACPQCGRGAE